MNLDLFKNSCEQIINKYPNDTRGQKYIKNWGHYLKEKRDIVRLLDLPKNSDVLDIGTGIGLLPLLLQRQDCEVDGTDIEDGIFKECCDLLDFNRFYLEIKPYIPMNLPRSYDVIIATRTVFDREFDYLSWDFFVKDALKHCDRLFLKTNEQNNIFPDKLQKYLSYPQITGKSYCLDISSEY